MKHKYDALLIASFGGPEGMNDVMPFLENVLRGKNVPEERKKEVAQHYEMFDGVSPINGLNRELKTLLEEKFKEKSIHLPVFWGNRNWKPYFKDVVLEMKEAGVKNALAYITSAYGSYPGCRKYLEDIEQARKEVGAGAPEIHRLPLFYNHPNFIQANVKHILEELKKIPVQEKNKTQLIFTAHSIPLSMSSTSPYVAQLNAACELAVKKCGIDSWKLVFQSRSGLPTVPWLGPDIREYLAQVAKQHIKHVIVSPIGFVFDHMEVLYDLDLEAMEKSEELGLNMHRASTAGNDPLMIDMIVNMVQEQLKGSAAFICAPDCCNNPQPKNT